MKGVPRSTERRETYHPRHTRAARWRTVQADARPRAVVMSGLGGSRVKPLRYAWRWHEPRPSRGR